MPLLGLQILEKEFHYCVLNMKNLNQIKRFVCFLFGDDDLERSANGSKLFRMKDADKIVLPWKPDSQNMKVQF